MINEEFARVYRETVGRAGSDGIARLEAFEEAEASISASIRAGHMEIDLSHAVRAQLSEIDKRDGKSADQILHDAARGLLTLDGIDVELVATLGDGLRKQWDYVTASDLQRMNELRFGNVQKAISAYSKWQANYNAVLPILFQHSTWGDAQTNGAFTAAVRSAA